MPPPDYAKDRIILSDERAQTPRYVKTLAAAAVAITVLGFGVACCTLGRPLEAPKKSITTVQPS